ncbi:MAG: hypothetical protein Q9170_006403 [Blastenia crenularia]
MFLLHSILATCNQLITVPLGLSCTALSYKTHLDRVVGTKLENRQTAAVIANENFLRRAYHTCELIPEIQCKKARFNNVDGSLAAVAGNYLYIDGGEFSFRDASTILSIDLSQNWVNNTVVFYSTSKPTNAPELSSTSSLFYDEGEGVFYTGLIGRISKFGGSLSPPPLSLWLFKPEGDGSGPWNEKIAAVDARLSDLKRSDSAYVASGRGIALMLGGRLTDQTDNRTTGIDQIPGVVELNMTSQEFTISSVVGFTANGTRRFGRMQYVPSLGPEGLFMFIGGVDNDTLLDFESIWVYKAVTKKLYRQTAIGNPPTGRVDFCLAGVNSTEESYEM